METMINKLLTGLMILVGINAVQAQQTPDSAVLDGHLYLKVNDQSDKRLDSGQIPVDFQTVKSQFGIDSLWRPFTELNDKLDRTYELTFDTSNGVSNLISALEGLTYIQYAERVPLHFTTQLTPNDYDQAQYYLDQIEAKQAWDVTKGSSEIVIGIVDNAVLLNHEDLLGNLWTNEDETEGNNIDDDVNGYTDDVHGYDVADDNGDPNPPGNAPASFSHGSHVAGLASASTDNNRGIAGLGFNCHLMAVKCSSDSSDGRVLQNAYDGVYYAIQNNADIINMSWGGPNMTVTGSNIFQSAQAQDIALIAAAGNAGSDDKHYPAAYEEVMAIGATNSNDEKSSYSNYGSWITVMAPGNNMKSTLAQSQSDYGKLNGTSMASPLVSGLAGLVKSVDQNITNADLRQQIKGAADDISEQNSTYENQLGAGRINARKTLQEASSIEPSANQALFTIYPKPAKENVYFQFDKPANETFHLKLLDEQGRLVLSKDAWLKKGDSKEKLSIDSLEPGLYFAVLQGRDQILRHKVLVR